MDPLTPSSIVKERSLLVKLKVFTCLVAVDFNARVRIYVVFLVFYDLSHQHKSWSGPVAKMSSPQVRLYSLSKNTGDQIINTLTPTRNNNVSDLLQ